MGNYQVIMKGDELYHWKYIDKYKKNGKWVYAYKKAEPVNKKVYANYNPRNRDLEVRTRDESRPTRVYTKYNPSIRVLARRSLKKAYEKVTSSIKKIANKAPTALRDLIAKGKHAVDERLTTSHIGELRKASDYKGTVLKGDPKTKWLTNTYIKDTKALKMIRKGKKIIDKALGRNTNTYRVDRLR